MAQLDGARLVRFDADGLLLAWFGGHGVHAFNADGVEVDYFSVGDFSKNDAETAEVEASMARWILGDDEDDNEDEDEEPEDFSSTLAASPRTARYLAKCDAEDPLVIANRLLDEAVALQDCGDPEAGEALLDRADTLLNTEDA